MIDVVAALKQIPLCSSSLPLQKGGKDDKSKAVAF
jgi:hypothetical protein